MSAIGLVTPPAGRRIAEIPIMFTERVAGESKMSPEIVLEALREVPRLRSTDPRPA